jgi:hypothetical protein
LKSKKNFQIKTKEQRKQKHTIEGINIEKNIGGGLRHDTGIEAP